MSTGGIVLVALAIAVGIIGIIVPLLPGILLVYAAILVWAVVEHNVAAWVTLGVVTVLIGATTLIKYMWPMKRMRAADVGTGTLLAGAVLGIIGFFVIPIVGLVIGFVLGRVPGRTGPQPRPAGGVDVDEARAQGSGAVGGRRTGRRAARHGGVGVRGVRNLSKKPPRSG